MTEPAEPSRPYAYHLTVQAGLRDTDGLGHVNNAVYVNWLEEVRTRYVFDARGLEGISNVDFILASVHVEFRSPVFLHELVDLWCSPSRVGQRSWELVYEGRSRRDGRLVFEARTAQVQFDYGRREPVPIPAEWRRILEEDMSR